MSVDSSRLYVSTPFQQTSQSWHATLWSCARIQWWCVGHAFASVHQLPSKWVSAALLRFQLFWSLVPVVIRSHDACSTPVRPTIVLRSHLRGCKGLAGKGWKPGRHAWGGTDQNVHFVLWGLRLHSPSSPHSLCDIRYHNCKLYIRRVKSQMHMSQQRHKVNLLSLISARTSAQLWVSVGGRRWGGVDKRGAMKSKTSLPIRALGV